MGILQGKAAVYARVSTRDKGQNPENQLQDCRRFAAEEGYEIVAEYVDHDSGAKADRPRFQAMIESAARREFQVLLFWSVDRLSRLGMVETLNLLATLSKRHKVRYRSIREPYIDTATSGEWGELLVAFIAKIADLERRRIRDRIMAGLDRAKAEGKKLGRPRKVFRRDLAADLRRQGLSLRQIAAELEVSKGTVQNVLRTTT